MQQTAFSFRFCFPQIDRQTAVSFLYQNKEELHLADETAVSQVVDLVFDKGGVFGGFDRQQQMQGMLGFFFGEPQQEYRNKEVLFMYVAAIAPSYRLTRMFHTALTTALHEFQKMGLEEIRLQAEDIDRYTNKLYGRFAQPISEDVTIRGIKVITYGGSIENALAYLQRGRQPQFHHTPHYSDRNTAQHAAALLP
ncbi:MAG: hypothetical protein KDE56_12310 [Anaerolineales bacterium]|nr:hypothetical protein [Anaerolineales bacterium]MCB9432509.1 hypothetical protein [Ardenticatenaceae bacterium]